LADLAHANLGEADFGALEAFVRERVKAAIADPDQVESEVATITEMLALRDADRPLCAFCRRPGGNLVAIGDGALLHLHRECEERWIENRMAKETIWRA
jgi:hypothetical protein